MRKLMPTTVIIGLLAGCVPNTQRLWTPCPEYPNDCSKNNTSFSSNEIVDERPGNQRPDGGLQTPSSPSDSPEKSSPDEQPSVSDPKDDELEGDSGGPVDDDTPNDGHGNGGGNSGKDREKSNASANNGKGGNYDKTGHSDNGKGNGKGRRDE